MLIENLAIILFAFITMALLLWAFFNTFQLLFSYRLDEKRLAVLLFHYLPIFTVHYSNIAHMKTASFLDVFFIPGIHIFRYPFARRAVIKRKKGWFKLVFLTPDDPENFIATINARITAGAK